MPKFTVSSPLEHDGKAYAVGDTITVGNKVAAPLLAAGVLAEEGAEQAAVPAGAGSQQEPPAA